MIKDKVKHFLFVGIFGLVIPVALFLKAYPLGPQDMFERVKFEFKMSQFHNEKDILLSHMFDPMNLGYWLDSEIIENATSDTRINILVSENIGGAGMLLGTLQDAIQKSKAMIVVSVAKFGLSCGTYILNMGDYLVLPNDSLILFHLGSVNGKNTNDFSNDPEVIEAAKMGHHFFEGYRPWITDAEYDQFRHGADIFVTGKSICEGLDGRKAPVLFTYKDGCVIKGFKK